MYEFIFEINEKERHVSNAEFSNNEDAKRHLKSIMKEIGVEKGRYVFVRIIKKDVDGDKEIINDLWSVN
jgi:coenzyme F420-reducing hydrogenase delta subunit